MRLAAYNLRDKSQISSAVDMAGELKQCYDALRTHLRSFRFGEYINKALTKTHEISC